MRFRPHPIVTPLALAVLAVLIALGAWQLERLEWKRAKQAEIDARASGEPAALGDVLAAQLTDNAEPAAELEYQRVRVSGVFDHGREIHLWDVLEQGAGWRVITPMDVQLGADGPAVRILVDRGLAPPKLKEPAGRAANLPEGEVTLDGLVRFGGAQGWNSAGNDPAANEWYWLDLPAMAEAARAPGGEPAAPGFLITALPDPSAPAPPRGGSSRTELSNRHLEYVVTWWGVAAALAAIYLAWHAREGRLTLNGWRG